MSFSHQDPNANPFEPLELIRKREMGKTRSACVEFAMEPYALYVVAHMKNLQGWLRLGWLKIAVQLY